jgi:hypothetical protein
MNEFENVFTIPEGAAIVLADLLIPLKPTLTQEIRTPAGAVYQVALTAGVEVEVAERGQETAVTVMTGDTTRLGVPQEYETVLRRLERRWPGIVEGEQQAVAVENGEGEAWLTRPVEIVAKEWDMLPKRVERWRRITQDYIPRGLTQEQMAEQEDRSVQQIKEDHKFMRKRGLIT